ncbi:unnamed protein product, partial [Polarella glacialis]
MERRQSTDAMQMLHSERLQGTLNDLTCRFWKARKHPDWVTPEGAKAISKYVHKLWLFKRMRMNTCYEVSIFMLRREKAAFEAAKDAAVAHTHGPEDAANLKSFWEQFHRGGRKGDHRPLTPLQTELYSPGMDASRPFSKSKVRASSTGAGPLRPWVEGE